jgi:hypothetical protein
VQVASSRGRILLLAVPLSAVLVVLLGVISGGARAYRSARVYGGPTQGLSELSLRVELGERDQIAEVPVPRVKLVLVAIEGGQRVATAQGQTDEQGVAEVLLRLPRPRDSAFELWVEPASQVEPLLAKGLVLGSTAAFQAAARRRGGFTRGRHTGDLELSVAPARGVLVTAQGVLDDELVIMARAAGNPVPGARVGVKLEGAEPASAELWTGEDGLAKLKLRPSDVSVRVALNAAAEGIGSGTLAARLDVVQGAIRATRRDGALLVESSGAATLAYLALFDERRRYAGLRVPLAAAPDGRLLGEVPWPSGVGAQPLWVVASSQPDLASPSAVGWPVASGTEPAPKTFDARELLLLDGAPGARQREQKRVQRIRIVTVGYAALALAVTLLLFVRRVREADATIDRHLARSGVDDASHSIVPERCGRTLLAAACIGLGFLVVALLALFKD